MKTILILGERDDDHIIEVLKWIPPERKVHLLTLDQLISNGYTLSLEDSNLQLATTDFVITDRESHTYTVWLRKPDYSFYFSPSLQLFENQYLLEETSAFFEIFLRY